MLFIRHQSTYYQGLCLLLYYLQDSLPLNRHIPNALGTILMSRIAIWNTKPKDLNKELSGSNYWKTGNSDHVTISTCLLCSSSWPLLCIRLGKVRALFALGGWRSKECDVCYLRTADPTQPCLCIIKIIYACELKINDDKERNIGKI